MSRLSSLAVAACFLSASFLSASLPAHAQNPDNSVHAPDGGAMEMIDSISIPAVTNAPFQGTVTLKWTRHLADGSTLIVGNHRLVVRDRQGNIYQERRTLVPDGSTQEPQIRWIEISNPSKHTKYFCNAALTQCTLRGYYAVAQPVPAAKTPATQSANGAASSTNTANGQAPGRISPPSNPARNPNLVHTDLGTRSIEGLDAVGSRESITIPPGAMGNSTPLERSKEFWYSPQLGLNLRVLRVDPLHGEQSFQVTDLTLQEPDPQRFVLPPNCKIVDLRRNDMRKNPGAQKSDSGSNE